MTDPQNPASTVPESIVTNAPVNTPTPPVPESERGQWLKANTLVVAWIVFLGFGGGLLALYYARIGYLPEIDWSASLIYLAVVTIIGGGVGGLFALSLFVPGFIWATFIVDDSELGKQFCYQREKNEPCVRAIWIQLGAPFVVVLLLSHISLIVVGIDARGSTLAGKLIYAAIASALLVRLWFFMRKRFGKLLPARDPDSPLTESAGAQPNSLSKESQESESAAQAQADEREERKRRIFKYTIWFAVSVLVSQISMFLVYLVSGKPRGPYFSYFIFLTIMCTVGVLVSNHFVAIRCIYHPVQAVIATLIVAMLLLCGADRFSSLSARIMGLYGFGPNHKVNLLLSEQGIAIATGLDLKSRCAAAKLCNVEILSKVGNEYYLALSGKTLTLPKSAVIALEASDQGPLSPAANAACPCP